MVRITSHTLNGVDGSHASGIPVEVRRLDNLHTVCSGEMDAGGRFAADIEMEDLPPTGVRCEAVFSVGSYWRTRGYNGNRIIEEIVLRFTIDHPTGSHHMPMIISPHGYSTWKSG